MSPSVATQQEDPRLRCLIGERAWALHRSNLGLPPSVGEFLLLLQDCAVPSKTLCGSGPLEGHMGKWRERADYVSGR